MACPEGLRWQSKLVCLVVLPFAGVEILLQAAAWEQHAPGAFAWTLGLSSGLALLALLSHAGTAAAALVGGLITASLMFSTASEPFAPWHTALVPVLVFLTMTSLATRFGRSRKEWLGTAEERKGRGAAQVCANMGMAALLASPVAHIWLSDLLPGHFAQATQWFSLALAALAEAAADTISSEIGQVLGGMPVMLTTFRRVAPGTDGAISLAGTAAGVVAAGIVAAAGAFALHGDARTLLLAWAGGVVGLLFDSLLGATLERRDWLNNDAVNFLSTGSASAFTLLLLLLVA